MALFLLLEHYIYLAFLDNPLVYFNSSIVNTYVTIWGSVLNLIIGDCTYGKTNEKSETKLTQFKQQ